MTAQRQQTFKASFCYKTAKQRREAGQNSRMIKSECCGNCGRSADSVKLTCYHMQSGYPFVQKYAWCIAWCIGTRVHRERNQ